MLINRDISCIYIFICYIENKIYKYEKHPIFMAKKKKKHFPIEDFMFKDGENIWK